MKTIFSFLVLLSLVLVICLPTNGQIIAPFSQRIAPPDDNKEKSTGDLNSVMIMSPGKPIFYVMPFLGKGELLRQYYSKDRINTPNSVSISAFISDSNNVPSVYSEFLSYIPKSGIGKIGVGLQLNSQERNDSIDVAKIATQKLLNKGGNLSLTLSRPVIYGEFKAWKGNFFYLDGSVGTFIDVAKANSKAFNPGLGGQLSLTGDFRLFSESTNSQVKELAGNLFRLGVKPNYVFNFRDKKFSDDPNLNYGNNISFGTLEIYLGLAFFDIRYQRIISNNSLFAGKQNMIEVVLVPAKF